MSLPRIAVIGTGGTISSVGRDTLDTTRYVELRRIYTVDELLARIPEAGRFADVVPVPYKALPSMALGPVEWLDLARFVHDLVARDPSIDGIVITHGTATLEETAYFLNLTLKVTVPVVIVGAQRPATGLSTDGPMNIVDAVRVAGAPHARGLGVLVVLNDEIFAARDVTKTSGTRLQTFRSPDWGALGHVDADRVAIYRTPTRRRAPDTGFDVSTLRALPRVDIALAYAGADAAAIDAFVQAGAEGIVSAGFPPGFPTAQQLAGFEAARARGVVIVQSHRAGTGRVTPIDFMRVADCVLADDLTPQKARILLMLGLTQTREPARLQELFDSC